MMAFCGYFIMFGISTCMDKEPVEDLIQKQSIVMHEAMVGHRQHL